jgi:hypothetical protein
MSLKKFQKFILENYKDIDPFGEEDWDEVQGEILDNNDEEVEDFRGDFIPRDEAIWCEIGGAWCHYNDAQWSEREGEYVVPGHLDYIWVETEDGNGDFVHLDDAVLSKREDAHILMDEAVWCEYDDDTCFASNATRLQNGLYAFTENVGKDYRGLLYHKDTLVWDDNKDGYVYNGE